MIRFNEINSELKCDLWKGKKMLLKRMLSVVFVGVLVANCTTTGTQSANELDELGAANSHSAVNKQSRVIQRVGNSTNPELSGKDRDFWLELRGNEQVKKKAAGLLASGEWEAAAAEARLYLRNHPGDAWGLKMLATSLAVGKQFELANYYANLLSEKNEASDPDLENIKAITILTGTNITYPDYVNARDILEATFEAHPGHLASGINLADLHLRLGNVTNAKAVYGKVLARKSDVIPARLGYGIACQSLKQYKEAEKALEAVLEKHKNHPEALYHLALVHKNGYNNKKEAESYLNRIIALEDEQFRHHKEKAFILKQSLTEEPVGDETFVEETVPQEDADAKESNLDEPSNNDLQVLVVDDEEEAPETETVSEEETVSEDTPPQE